MKAKHWEMLLSWSYALERLSPLKWVQNFLYDRYDNNAEREYVAKPDPDYYVGRIEQLSISADELDCVTICLTNENGDACRIFECLKDGVTSFGILGEYGLFKRVGMTNESQYRLLFIKSSHKEARDAYLDFYHEDNTVMQDLCDEEFVNV